MFFSGLPAIIVALYGWNFRILQTINAYQKSTQQEHSFFWSLSGLPSFSVIMPISLVSWHAAIGLFDSMKFKTLRYRPISPSGVLGLFLNSILCCYLFMILAPFIGLITFKFTVTVFPIFKIYWAYCVRRVQIF